MDLNKGSEDNEGLFSGEELIPACYHEDSNCLRLETSTTKRGCI